ncbi:hypothetical protein [Halorussus halobius]|uniref:hypothetical protein n=1 Tax=Halorussus halobius TaxID=1710537 RepID=UPI00109272BE|nr:hypothetical protein [Halorussus halobius]
MKRRNLLEVLTTGAAISLAGCSGNVVEFDDATSTEPTSGSETETPAGTTTAETTADAQGATTSETETEAETETETETKTETPSDPDRIARENDGGEVFQTATVTDAPDEIRAGESVSVTGEVTAEISSAGGNIVYGAVGTPGGELFGLTQMSGSGSGTVTVSAELPDDAAGGDLIWTFIPATSDRAARNQFASEADAGRYDPDDLGIELGTVAGTDQETETETPSDPDRIARKNDDGDVFQTATVTDAPDEIRAGETVSVTGAVNAEISSAGGNVVYGAVGTPTGELYGLARMSGSGSGTVTVRADVPADAGGNAVMWTFIPATSDRAARNQFTDEADAGRYEPADLGIELGTVAASEAATETETPSDAGQIARENDDGDVFQTATVTDAPDEVRAGETVSVTGEITAEISSAGGNIVYGAVGTPSGDLYGLAQMSGSGSGTVTVSATIPDDAGGDTVIWTFIPATSDRAARNQFASEADAGRYEPDDLGIELGTVE